MMVIESFRDIIEILLGPLQDLFGFFPDFKVAFEGFALITLAYFGWRAIK